MMPPISVSFFLLLFQKKERNPTDFKIMMLMFVSLSFAVPLSMQCFRKTPKNKLSNWGSCFAHLLLSDVASFCSLLISSHCLSDTLQNHMLHACESISSDMCLNLSLVAHLLRLYKNLTGGVRNMIE